MKQKTYRKFILSTDNTLSTYAYGVYHRLREEYQDDYAQEFRDFSHLLFYFDNRVSVDTSLAHRTYVETLWFKTVKYIKNNPGCTMQDLVDNVSYQCRLKTTKLLLKYIYRVREGRLFKYYLNEEGNSIYELSKDILPPKLSDKVEKMNRAYDEECKLVDEICKQFPNITAAEGVFKNFKANQLINSL